MLFMFNIIVGVSNNNGIGYNNKIPWKNREDMMFFKNISTTTQNNSKQNAIIMGRKTFESLGKTPLKNRHNIVITRQKYNNVDCFVNLDECLDYCKNQDEIESIFVIGGETLYKEAVKHPLCKKIYLNKVNTNDICDTFFNYEESEFNVVETNQISDTVTSYVLEKNN